MKNIKKLIALLLATCIVASLAACGSQESETSDNLGEVSSTNPVSDDQAAADEVAKLIDAIYVQERNENTDEQCEAAKAAWDALTDAQKELVSGEFADPDYFGRDTGDASKDDPRNGDEIGENELLVVSFGTSFNDSRVADIKSIEDALQEAYPDWSVRRAFTAQIIINHVQARDGEKIDNVQQALDRAVENGVKNLVIQPTHLMNGLEYNDLVNEVAQYSDAFESVAIGLPLLTSDEDFQIVADAIVKATASYDDGKTAICFMGHGTEAESNAVYAKMQQLLTDGGHENYFVGTVEATPSLEDVLALVQAGSYERVVLQPLMIVAGDHANNDMAGNEEGSWKTTFEAAGYQVECLVNGLGELEAVQNLLVAHAQAAIDALN